MHKQSLVLFVLESSHWDDVDYNVQLAVMLSTSTYVIFYHGLPSIMSSPFVMSLSWWSKQNRVQMVLWKRQQKQRTAG